MAPGNENPKKPRTTPPQTGTQLRSLRTGRGLTLEQLSRMAGVSKAMLSQIEQHKVNPTVAVMLKIADALQLGIGDLINVPAKHNIFRVISSSDRHYTFRADSSCTIRTLSPLSLEKTLEFYRLTFEPSGELRSEPHFPGTEEFIHLAQGKLAVLAGEQEVQLGRGDSIHYRADIPHLLRNAGKGQAIAYMIVRYKSD